VNLHDNDLVPIDATPSERDAIVRDFKRACKENGLVVPMATVSLFFIPFSATALSRQTILKSAPMRCKNHARDGSRRRARRKDFVLWGGREGLKPMLAAAPTKPLNGCASINFLVNTISIAVTNIASLWNRTERTAGDIYMATTGHYLGFIPTLDHRKWSASTLKSPRANGRTKFHARRCASMGSR